MSDLWWLLREYANIIWKIESGRSYDDFERVRIHTEIEELLKIKDDEVKKAELEVLLHNFPSNNRDGYLMHEAERIINDVIMRSESSSPSEEGIIASEVQNSHILNLKGGSNES